MLLATSVGVTHRRTLARRRFGPGPATGWVIGFTLLISAITGAESTGRSSARSVASSEGQLIEYRGVRRMHAKSDKLGQEATLEAWTELDAQGFRYTVLEERGSEYVRNKVLRAVLQREHDMIAAGQAERAAITEDNYVFGEESLSDDGLREVPIKPRRKEVTLVDGRLVLGPDGSLLRIEGRLAKNPSFWTSLVTIKRHFATVDGVRVPVSTESVAKLRFAGQSRLDVSYEYESINGRPVTVATRRVLAMAMPRAGLPGDQ